MLICHYFKLHSQVNKLYGNPNFPEMTLKFVTSETKNIAQRKENARVLLGGPNRRSFRVGALLTAPKVVALEPVLNSLLPIPTWTIGRRTNTPTPKDLPPPIASCRQAGPTNLDSIAARSFCTHDRTRQRRYSKFKHEFLASATTLKTQRRVSALQHWAFTTGDQRFSAPATAYFSVYGVR